ncbi:MAG TPA: glycosyltransferase [Candidatus Saccharimonadales bacterium]|nr:glycosyltransferase [Candidatus Saccharimonadales bacterium]
MVVLTWLFGLGVAFELFLQLTPFGWRARKLLAPLSVLCIAFNTGSIVVERPGIAASALLLLSAYRIINLSRILEARMHETYLRRATRRTSVVLLGFQGALCLLWFAFGRWSLGNVAWAVLVAVQLVIAAGLLASTLRRLKHTAWQTQPKNHLSDHELPTLSVAIPARNETEDLEVCLQSLVASDYPKLEILVLDDCSQTTRTPEIIRAFAHDGVRFVQGAEPHSTWLPKNAAYARLTEEASGDYLLFCGADIRFAPQSLRLVMELLVARHKQMLSILPRRTAQTASFSLAQGMRYYWELAPPRRLFRRPAVLDSCWVISRAALNKVGGFASVARSIVPLAPIARQLLPDDAYSFMRAGKNPGIESAKSERDQRDTAIRTRYPQLHRRPENVCLLALFELVFFVLPFALALAGRWLGVSPAAQLTAATAAAMLLVSYYLIASSTRLHALWLAGIALPFVVLYDTVLLHVSMWQYEFSVVDWRGRNICVPAMHVVPHLPRLDDSKS